MKYIDEYRNKELVSSLLKQIRKVSRNPVRLMEVCGGHTMAIRKFGIHNLLPETIELLSGPGCPVCVTGKNFIDKAIALTKIPKTIINKRFPAIDGTFQNPTKIKHAGSGGQ